MAKKLGHQIGLEQEQQNQRWLPCFCLESLQGCGAFSALGTQEDDERGLVDCGGLGSVHAEFELRMTLCSRETQLKRMETERFPTGSDSYGET